MRRHHLFCAAIVTLCLAVPALAQTGRVGGVVKDTEGKPIKGASVKAVNPAASPSEFTATTDDKGRFSMIGLRSGTWKFIAEAPGFLPQEGNAPVRTIGAPNPPLEFTLGRGAAAGPAALSKEVQAELKAADELRNAGQFDQAIAAYQGIRSKNPTLTMVNMVIAGAYRQKAGKETDTAARKASFDQAIAAYQEVLKSDAANERAKIEIGMTHMQAGNLDAAEQALQPVADSPSASREVFYNLGEIKFNKGDAAAAEAMYKRASDMDPNWQLPKLKLGLIAYGKGDRDTAIKIFEGIIAAADPNSAEAAQANAFLKDLKK
jgi:lipopolysaccharide biosynthesis regulator YciM